MEIGRHVVLSLPRKTPQVAEVAADGAFPDEDEMELLYFDESGDDGLGPGASPLFALTCLRVSANDWPAVAERIEAARNMLASLAGLPARGELHTRQLLLRKGRYHELRIRTQTVLTVIRMIGELAASPEIRIHSEVLLKSPGVQCLRTVLGAQMLRNTRSNIAISDRGRVPRMRHIIRLETERGAIPLPPIEGMLEIESRDCAMVQLADFFATAAYLRASAEAGHPHHARMIPEEAAAMIRTTEGANRTYRLVRPAGTA
jgi:hypothetical protein